MEKNNPKILFEDSDILVLDKPAGVAVTRAETVKSPTLQDWLEEFFKLGGNLGIGGRAGIIHRLDRQTSGVILIAKTWQSFDFLQRQFQIRKISKKYLTLVHNHPKTNSFEVNLPIARQKFGKFGVRTGGKVASTIFKILERLEIDEDKFVKICQNLPKKFKNYLVQHATFYTFCEATPTTGRTHQIRVHAKFCRFPVVSDPLYTPRKLFRFDQAFCPRLFLHAAKITLIHPKSLKLVTYEAKLPADLELALQYLKKAN